MLTRRQTQVLNMRADGLSNRQIGRQLGIAPATVGCHSEEIRRRLHAKDNAHAIAIAFRTGLLMKENTVDINQDECESGACFQVWLDQHGNICIRGGNSSWLGVAADSPEAWFAFRDEIKAGKFDHVGELVTEP